MKNNLLSKNKAEYYEGKGDICIYEKDFKKAISFYSKANIFYGNCINKIKKGVLTKTSCKSPKITDIKNKIKKLKSKLNAARGQKIHASLLENSRFYNKLKPIVILQGIKRRKEILKILEEFARSASEWVEANKHILKIKKDETIMDCVIRVFYSDYLEIPKSNMKIIEKTEKRMISKFDNDCPILNACEILGLDTRVICKEICHAPFQELLSHIHPGLKFERDYRKGIRPYNKYCVEIISVE